MLNPGKEKAKQGMNSEDISKLESEMASLERDFKAVEENYGENMLNLTVIRGYVKKLLVNTEILRFLRSNYPDFLPEFETLVASEIL